MFMSKYTHGNIRDDYQQNKHQSLTFDDRHHIKSAKNTFKKAFQRCLSLFTQQYNQT
ncbi:hypothetical protein D3C75_573430 [compost metagenome]